MSFIHNTTSFTGRILLSAIFISAGVSKLGAGYAGTQAYMAMMGVPEMLLPLVIATEILGGVAILLGFYTRIAAFLLGGFTILAALLFHFNFADQMQSILFMKNVAIAGGLLSLVAHGGGYLSIDKLRLQTV